MRVRVAILGSLWLVPFAVSGLAAQDRFAIRDVRVFDGERVLERRTVLVERGKIVRIGGPSLRLGTAEVVPCEGCTLLPGLIDSHVHVGGDVNGALRQALVLGVTTVLDMFNGGERLKQLKQVASDDPLDVADVRTAGIGATAPGGHPTQMGGMPFPTVAGPDQAKEFVAARVVEGSDYIKIIYDDLASLGMHLPMLSKPTLEALIREAHQQGKLAVVHVLSEEQARTAIAAGADGLAHMFTGETASPDFGRFVARHRAFVIPTLSILYGNCGMSEGPALAADPNLQKFIRDEWRRSLEIKLPFPPQSCSGALQGIRQLRDARVPILAGTDAPVPGTTYGASIHGELSLLVRAGLTPVQALAAASSTPARTFGLTDRGRIRRGMRADLLLVRGDPTRNILATRDIVAVWKRGVRVQRE